MASIKIRLFGKLSINGGDQRANANKFSKSLELFGFLLMHRDSLYTREQLATMMWNDYSASQSRKCLRQTLWQLQTVLGGHQSRDILRINAEWVGINPAADLWLDIAAFEDAYIAVKNRAPEQLEKDEIESVRRATDLYRGDLLNGCYEDWCLCERERFRDMYLILLLKLICYCEVNGRFDQGIEYGKSLLRFDHAHERTHRIMMRLRYQSGDRTGALQQYRRCREALAKELDAEPSHRTEKLYHQILNDSPEPLTSRLIDPLTHVESATASLPEILNLLRKLSNILPELEVRIRQDLQLIDHNRNGPGQQSLFHMEQFEETAVRDYGM